jgi:hypothetical protein
LGQQTTDWTMSGVAACFEGFGSDRGEVRRGPGGGFRALDYDGVAGEDGGDYGADEIVERIAVSTLAAFVSYILMFVTHFQLTQAATTPSGS